MIYKRFFDTRARKCHDGNNTSLNVEETDKNRKHIEHPQHEIKRNPVIVKPFQSNFRPLLGSSRNEMYN